MIFLFIVSMYHMARGQPVAEVLEELLMLLRGLVIEKAMVNVPRYQFRVVVDHLYFCSRYCQCCSEVKLSCRNASKEELMC